MSSKIIEAIGFLAAAVREATGESDVKVVLGSRTFMAMKREFEAMQAVPSLEHPDEVRVAGVEVEEAEPDSTIWLTPTERRIAQAKLNRMASDLLHRLDGRREAP